MSWPSAESFCAIVSSDRIALPSSASIIALIRLFTASADTAPSPCVSEIPLEKKYLSSNSTRAQERYLLLVTRLTVDSCIPIASATRTEETKAELQFQMR